MKRSVFAVLSGAMLLAPRPASSDEAPATATDPSVRARATLTDIQNGTLDRSTLTPALSAVLTDDVRKTMTALVGPYGTPKQFAALSKTDVDGVTTYVYRMTWPAGSVDYVFGIDDKTDKIAKLFLRPGPPA